MITLMNYLHRENNSYIINTIYLQLTNTSGNSYRPRGCGAKSLKQLRD